MWSLVLVFTIQIAFTKLAYSDAVPANIYTEGGGGPDSYPSDEEIADRLQQQADPDWRQGTEDDGGFDEERMGINPDRNVGEENEEQAVIHKREGQAEFATFVDPTQNRRLVSEKQLFHGGGYEKRAKVEASNQADGDVGDTLFIAVTTVCTAAAVFGLVAAAFVWRRVHNRHLAARESEYPAYGVTGPAKERSGNTSPVAIMDAKLASSAQLYHYQHTKQQIIAMEQSTCESKGQDSEDSEGEEDEGDFSVYEYPGLASTGDIEVSNPLFENSSPKTKTDPKAAELEPAVHQRLHED